MAIALCLEELEPAVAFEFLFKGENLADFAILDLHQLVVHVASGVAFTQDPKGLIVLAFGNEVAR